MKLKFQTAETKVSHLETVGFKAGHNS